MFFFAYAGKRPGGAISAGAVLITIAVMFGCSPGSEEDADEAALAPPRPPAGRIVYEEGGRLWILDLATARRRSVAIPHPAFDPVFDPRRSTIAFRNDREDLFVSGVSGKPLRNVTRSEARESAPDWTPDGRRLIFAASPTFRLRLWSIALDGRRRTQIADVYADEPAVSPDGEWIAFRGDTPGTNGDIYLVRTNGRGLRQLTRFPDWELHPAWSPDGSKVVFTRGSPTGSLGGRKLWVIDRSGRGARQLTRGSGGNDDAPTWSPDGAWIAFSRDGRLRLVTADGRAERGLNVAGDFPDWG
jgi:Tol biopolymer transport system component